MFSRLNLFTIYLVGFLDHMGIGLIYSVFALMLFDQHSPILPPETSLEVRGLILGVLLGLTPLTQFFSAPILGALSDAKGRKGVLSFGISMGICGYLLAALGIAIGNIVLLFMYRICVGISDGTVAVASAALADVSTDENKARRFSLFSMALGLGFTVGPFLGGQLSDPSLGPWFGYMTPFVFAGFATVVNLILVVFKLPETRVVRVAAYVNPWNGIRQLRKAFTWKQLRFIFLGSFLFCFGWAFYAEFFPVLLTKRFGFTSGGVGNVYAYNGLWYALSAGLLTAPLLKRYSPEAIVGKALTLAGLYMPLFLIIERSVFIWLFLPFLNFLMALTYPTITAMVSNRAGKDVQGEAQGIYQAVCAFAIGISPVFAGVIIAEMPSMTIWGSGLTMGSAGIVLWIYGRRGMPSENVYHAENVHH